MATADSVKAKMHGLIASANAKTGGNDSTLTAVINALIAGFGQGGGPGGLAYDMGEFVLDADELYQRYEAIPHDLGAVPDFLVIWTDNFDDLSADNVSPYSKKAVVLVMRADGLTGMYQRLTSESTGNDKMFSINGELQVNDYRLYPIAPTAGSYANFSRSETGFNLPQVGSATYYIAGITYKYFVAKAWW